MKTFITTVITKVITNGKYCNFACSCCNGFYCHKYRKDLKKTPDGLHFLRLRSCKSEFKDEEKENENI